MSHTDPMRHMLQILLDKPSPSVADLRASESIRQSRTIHLIDYRPDESDDRSIPALVKAVVHHTGMPVKALARQAGISLTHFYQLMNGWQQSCYPETKAKLWKLCDSNAALREIYYRTNWGETCEKRSR
jgi:hypothetical protein